MKKSSVRVSYVWSALNIAAAFGLLYFGFEIAAPEALLMAGCAVGVSTGFFLVWSLRLFDGWWSRAFIFRDPAWALVLLLPPLAFITEFGSDLPARWDWHLRRYPHAHLDLLGMNGLAIGLMSALAIGFLKGPGPMLTQAIPPGAARPRV